MRSSTGAIAVILLGLAGPALADERNLVTLTHTGCQFIEAEGGVDHGFITAVKGDCDAINAQSAESRLQQVPPLELKPGRYTFRVGNRDVPYEVGFWIREADYDWRNSLHKLTKLSLSGSGLEPGMTKDFVVELKPGEYLYSCPLNATPDYRLIVRE